MYIIIVDDDNLQAEWLMAMLKDFFQNSKIEWVDTEYEFRSRIDEFAEDPPDIIVMDVMLRWTYPSEDMPVLPDEVEKEGFYTAGFRCEELLSGKEALKNVPLIFYTVLEKADLKKRYEFVPGSTNLLTKQGRAYLQKQKPRAYLRKSDEANDLINLILKLTKSLAVR